MELPDIIVPELMHERRKRRAQVYLPTFHLSGGRGVGRTPAQRGEVVSGTARKSCWPRARYS